MRTGDFVFTQIGAPSNAISVVTEGYKGARVNHVGIVLNTELGDFVLEAFPPEVRLTNLNVYLNRSRYESRERRHMAARLESRHQSLIPDAISYGLAQRDVPYDQRYLPDRAALYCSELIVDMFKEANGGQPFFEESPMTFRDPETGEVYQHWVEYYEQFGMDVPTREPGSNPGDLSKGRRLHIFDVVGPITGYRPN